MRAPAPSEPNSTFPTYQVPQVSAMRGSAPPVQQVARAVRGDGAEPPGVGPPRRDDPSSTTTAVPSDNSVINGSSCRTSPGNSNLKMQSVTDYCLLNTVTVPNKQRKDRTTTVAHNNSPKLDRKFGALPTTTIGRDIPNQKSDDLEEEPDNDDTSNNYTLERLIKLTQRTRLLEKRGLSFPSLRLCGGGESSLSAGTTGWGTPPSQQTGAGSSSGTGGWGTANPANPNSTGTQNWNNGTTGRQQGAGQGPAPQEGGF